MKDENVEERWAKVERAKIDLYNARFAVDMMPGCERAMQALNNATERYNACFDYVEGPR